MPPAAAAGCGARSATLRRLEPHGSQRAASPSAACPARKEEAWWRSARTIFLGGSCLPPAAPALGNPTFLGHLDESKRSSAGGIPASCTDRTLWHLCLPLLDERMRASVLWCIEVRRYTDLVQSNMPGGNCKKLYQLEVLCCWKQYKREF